MFASGKATLDEVRKRETVKDLDALIENAGKLVNEIREGVALLKLAAAAFGGVLASDTEEENEPCEQKP